LMLWILWMGWKCNCNSLKSKVHIR
jgi:hypothetical protein